MKRRKFIHLSALTALSLQSSLTLTGCGNSSSKKSTQLNAATIDDNVRSITALQSENELLHTQIKQKSVSLLESSDAAELFQKFQNNELTLTPNATDIYFPQNKLWSSYQASHSLAYEHLTSQLTKLKASFRIYDHKQTQQKQNGMLGAALAAPEQSPAIDSAVATFLQAVEDFKNLKFGAVAIDGLTLSIKLVYVVIEQVKDSTAGQYMLGLVFGAIESLLKNIQQKSLANLDFSSNQDIALSIAKMALAIISVQSLSTISTYSPQRSALNAAANEDATDTETATLIQNLVLQSQLISTLMAIINKIIAEVVLATTTLAGNVTDPNYQLTDADKALIASLKPLSSVLALLGLIVKALLSFYHNNIAQSEQSGAMQGDAQTYAPLFGNPTNPYDFTFSQFTSQNYDTLFASNPLLAQLLQELGVVNPNFETSASPEATKATADAESKAFAFASAVANPSYTINATTTTQASDFATHLADLAYQFVMKIEDDAYTFAMKGMEYGYLFASKGEEVGLMADRILFMAVQIGVMADRIGEMADRIVYTEQLIVYTEMLILDFGMLIYGSMKQISNFLLMGMAIIFDREWYTQADQSNDPVLNIISEMTKKMLFDMKVYEKQVLENQLKLRELTLKALDWIQGEY